MTVILNEQLLHDDLVIEILERLPVKSLLRFQCVSKFWYTLIKSPNFITNHLAKQQTKDSLVLMFWKYLPPPFNVGMFSFHDPESPKLDEICFDLSVPFYTHNYDRSHQLDFTRPICLLGPCKGLVLIAFDAIFRLCNPSLKQCKELPHCDIFYPDNDNFSYTRGQGFGYSCTGDYKVVQILAFDIDSELYIQVYVYNLRTNSWKRTDFDTKDVPYCPYVWNQGSQLFFNGVCHWNACHWNPEAFFFDYSNRAIISFNLNTESLNVMKYPASLKLVNDDNFGPFLMVIDQCLGLVEVGPGELLEVWVMKEYGVMESWARQFVVGPYPQIQPLVPWKNGKLLLATGSNDQLISCALNKTEFMKYEIDTDVDEDDNDMDNMRAVIYEESLISLDDIMKDAVSIEFDW